MAIEIVSVPIEAKPVCFAQLRRGCHPKNLGIASDLMSQGAPAIRVMWSKRCHKPPMTGNGHQIIYIFIYGHFIVILGGWFTDL